jgi:hypothetical protein
MRTLADFDQLRSGMALQAITAEGFTFGDCMEASWAALEALIEFDDSWAKHLVRVVGELHHPTAMEANGRGEHAWLEWREPGYPELVVDGLVAKFVLEGFDPTGLRWVEG